MFHLDPSLTPAANPPPGVESNLINPTSQRYITITVLVLVLCLSSPIVMLRMYTRRFINHKLWWDDWSCTLGWVGLVALAGIMLHSLKFGGSVDQWNVSVTHDKLFKKEFRKIEIVARIGMFFTKVAILLLFHRIFITPGSKKNGIFWAIWFVFCWNLFYALALVLAVLLECVGKEAKVARNEECVNTYAVLTSASSINLVSDLMILIIPVDAISRLHMPPKEKLRISAVFAVGALAVLASTARLGYQIVETKNPNQTVVVMNLLMLNIAEHTIGLVVGCMPILPAFFRRIKPNSQNLRKGFGSNVLGYKKTAKPCREGSDEPHLLDKDNLELADLENRRSSEPSGSTMTVSVIGGKSEFMDISSPKVR